MSKANQDINATSNAQDNPSTRDPLEANLTFGDDRLRLSDWTPPQSGIVPLIRFRKHWYSILLHGAPLRLRCENELGFKMVKWITAIEFVHDFADLDSGHGGYNEDHEFYGYRMPI